MTTIDSRERAVRRWLADSLVETASWRENVAADFPADARNLRAAKALRGAARYAEDDPESHGVEIFVAFANLCDQSGISLTEGSFAPEAARVASRYSFDSGGYEADATTHETLLTELYEATLDEAQGWYATPGSPIEAMQSARESWSPGETASARPTPTPGLAEKRAAAIVANARGAMYVLADRGQQGGQASHDFDLRYAGTQEDEPLEVTTAATAGAIATRAALRENPNFPEPRLGLAWIVIPPMSVGAGINPRTKKPLSTRWPIDKWHPQIVKRLQILEEAGVDRFPFGAFANLDKPAYDAVMWLVMHLQVGSGRECRPDEEPAVQYFGSYGGVGRAELAGKALLAEANEPGNRGKLSGTAAVRHLFIYVDQTAGDAWVSVRQGELPDRLDLPKEVTNLWVWADDLRVLEYTRQAGWVEHEVPIEVLMTPEIRELEGDSERGKRRLHSTASAADREPGGSQA